MDWIFFTFYIIMFKIYVKSKKKLMEGTVKIEKNCNLNVNSQQLDTKFPKKKWRRAEIKNKSLESYPKNHLI